MKRLLAIVVLGLALHGYIQAQSNDEKQLMASIESLRKAMLDPDRSKLESITASNLTYGHSAGKMENRAEFIEALVSGASDFTSINLTDQKIYLSGNTAVVRHTLSGSNNDGGKPGTVKLGVMTVWQKQQGKWKLLARQAIKLT